MFSTMIDAYNEIHTENMGLHYILGRDLCI